MIHCHLLMNLQEKIVFDCFLLSAICQYLLDVTFHFIVQKSFKIQASVKNQCERKSSVDIGCMKDIKCLLAFVGPISLLLTLAV